MVTNQEECTDLRNRILEILPVVMAEIKERSAQDGETTALPADLNTNIERFQQNLQSILRTLDKISSAASSKKLFKKAKAFIMASPNTAAITKCRDDLNWAITSFQVRHRLAESVRLCEVSQKVNVVSTKVDEVNTNVESVSTKVDNVFTTVTAAANTQFLHGLPRAKYASHNSERPDSPASCFEGTRTQILQMIFDWIVNLDPTTERIFFLNGIAGVGKTTIAHSVAERAQREGLLGADFFFSRQGEAELRDPAKVFPTLAYQLAKFDMEFGQRISKALETDPDAPFQSLKLQLDKLIIQPLSAVKRALKQTVVVVFDAFDECEAKGANTILQLLVAAIPSFPFFLKIFLTGRPEHHILSALVPSNGLHITTLHDIEPLIVKSDIRLYLKTKLASVLSDLQLSGYSEKWITDYEAELLIDKSDGLFIYAITALRFLSDDRVLDPRHQLDILLSIFHSNRRASDDSQPFRDLDLLYLQVLLNSLSPTSPSHVIKMLQIVLGTLILLRDPLPQDALERIAGLRPRQAIAVLRHLQSVISPAAPPDHCPRVYHPSFPDFLQDPTRCTDSRLCIDPTVHETRLALKCLEIAASELRKGMIDTNGPIMSNDEVPDLETKVTMAYPPTLQYSCRHWASHLARSAVGHAEIMGALEQFVLRALLPWLEAMSWLRETHLAAKCLEMSKAWATSSSCSETIIGLLQDTYRLLLANFVSISTSASQIAHSVFPFVPQDTSMASRYRDYADRTLAVVHGAEGTWPPYLASVRSKESFRSHAFSPDATRLVSGHAHGGTYGEVQIWDTTGALILTIPGPSGRSPADIRAVAFSRNGDSVISGAGDGTIGVWNATTGASVAIMDTHHKENGSRGFATHLGISPDGDRIAAVFDDEEDTIQVWEVDGGIFLTTLKDPSQPVDHLAFFPDGTHIASASKSDDSDIRVWDIKSESYTLVATHHSSPITVLAVSHDGARLASGSSARPTATVFVSESESGARLATFEMRSDYIQLLAFSPEGKYLVGVSWDFSVLVWNIAESQIVTALRGDNTNPRSLAFSSDGRRLASTYDSVLRVWDVAEITRLGIVQDIRSMPQLQYFFVSPDGSHVAAALRDKSFYVWNASSGNTLAVFKGHSGIVQCVAFSPEGFTVASCADDHSVRLWNLESGTSAAVLVGHTDIVEFVTFFPDGKRIASAAADRTVRIWNVATSTVDAVLDIPSSPSTTLLFSPDGNSAVLGLQNGAVRLWDFRDDEHQANTTSPATSQAQSTLGDKAEKKEIRHRDFTQTEDSTETPRRRQQAVKWVGFSPDDTLIGSRTERGSEIFVQWFDTKATEVTTSRMLAVGWGGCLVVCTDDPLFMNRPVAGDGGSSGNQVFDCMAVMGRQSRDVMSSTLGNRTKTWVLPHFIERQPFLRAVYLGSGRIRVIIWLEAPGEFMTLDVQM